MRPSKVRVGGRCVFLSWRSRRFGTRGPSRPPWPGSAEVLAPCSLIWSRSWDWSRATRRRPRLSTGLCWRWVTAGSRYPPLQPSRSSAWLVRTFR